MNLSIGSVTFALATALGLPGHEAPPQENPHTAVIRQADQQDQEHATAEHTKILADRARTAEAGPER